MPLTLLIGLLTLGAAIALSFVAMSWRPQPDAGHPGLAAINAIYSPAIDAHGEPGASAPLPAPLAILRALASRLSPATFSAKVHHRLDIAGNPRGMTVERVLAYKGAGLVLLALFGLFLGRHNPIMVIMAPVAAGALGFFVPDLLLYDKGQKRQLKIQYALPDALDLMTVCVEAGLGFDASIAQVARNTEGPLAAECARVLQEMQFGLSRIDALRALADRSTVTELKAFVSALVQASDLGIPVATVLREQANEMRVRRRQRGEEQAQKVTVKILFPLIFCLFPALMVVVIGPGAMNVMRMFSKQ